MDKNKPSILHTIIATMIMLIASFSANAEDFIVDGIYYNITSSEAPYTVEVVSSGYSSDIVIPESVVYNDVEYSVTSIGEKAFYNYYFLTSIEIPNSVISIGDHAFSGCYGLTSIEIPNSVISIGRAVFSGCDGLTSIEIPNSVTSIGDYAFYTCDGLTSIEIPNSVTSFGYNALESCNGLTSIVVEAGNSVYDSRENCNAVIETATNKLITGCMKSFIPNSVTSIGEKAFFYCIGLTSIEIPNSVISIGNEAFSQCLRLLNIEIPNSVTLIGEKAFSGCSVYSIVVEAGNSVYDSRENCNAIIETATGKLITGCMNSFIPNSVTSIEDEAFYSCGGLTSIEIPNSVTSIGDFAFWSCIDLTSIEIPNSVISIGVSAFASCFGLTSVSIGNSVTFIGESAFEWCSGLTSVTISKSVTSIGEKAFLFCTGLTNIVVEVGNPTYDSRENCNAIIETATGKLITGCNNSFIPNFVTSIGDYAFYSCSGLTSVDIPYSVTSICNGAFGWCSGLTSIKIPNLVTTIGDGAFSGCSGLTSVTIGKSVTSIGDFAFAYCSGLTSIEIPNFVTSIGGSAFSGCSGLTSIEIPNFVTSIGDFAFADCFGLASVTIPASIESMGINVFYCANNITDIYLQSAEVPTAYGTGIFDTYLDKSTTNLYVPVGSAALYVATEGWNEFNIVERDYIKPTLAELIVLDKDEINLKVDESAELVATILPVLTTDKSVIWSSSNNTVATVDDNGLVTAISVGEATITATAADGSNLSATCKVIVEPILAISIEVMPTEIEAEEGSDVQLSVIVMPEDATNKEVAWSSSNESIATVDNNGLVRIHKEGETTITATTTDGSNLSATCVIKAFSGIIEVTSINFYVKVMDNDIVVCDAELGSQVAVYTIDGQLVDTKEVVDTQTIIAAPKKDIYLVKVGQTTMKVFVK